MFDNLWRSDFPILTQTVYDEPLVYLDNAASAQKPRAVIEAMSHFMETDYANVHRGLHILASHATEAYENARKKVATFLKAAHSDEIIFTRSATEAINLVAYSYGSMHFQEGDEIILSIMEHHANIVPWHFYRERHGVKLKWVYMDENGEWDWDRFDAAFSSRTKFVAITHMSNVMGTLVPVKEMITRAHQHGVPVLVDGSQAVIHSSVDVHDLDADFYVFTGHKLYGPTGIGVLYGKKEILETMPPFNGGGEMIDEVTIDKVTYGPPPRRFEAGTPPIVEAIGLSSALSYLENIEQKTPGALEAHAYDISHYLKQALDALPYVHIFGPGGGPIVSFTVDGIHAHDVAMIADRCGVALRAGTHCAMPLLTHFGARSLCRASCALYTNRADIHALIHALEKARKIFS
jgi:cysteine desulfurase/selenocysteine lyase